MTHPAKATINIIKQQYLEKGEFPSMMEPIVGQKGIYILETYVNGSAGHSSRIK